MTQFHNKRVSKVQATHALILSTSEKKQRTVDMIATDFPVVFRCQHLFFRFRPTLVKNASKSSDDVRGETSLEDNNARLLQRMLQGLNTLVCHFFFSRVRSETGPQIPMDR